MRNDREDDGEEKRRVILHRGQEEKRRGEVDEGERMKKRKGEESQESHVTPLDSQRK